MIITRKRGLIVEGIRADKGMLEMLQSVIILDLLDDKMDVLTNIFTQKDKQVSKMTRNHFRKTQGHHVAEFFGISYDTDGDTDPDLDKMKEKIEFTIKQYIDKRAKKLGL